MGTTGLHRRPGKFQLIWIRIVRVFSKDRGEFRLFAVIEQLETSCREQYDRIRGLIQGQDELRRQIRERESELLAAGLEILDLKRALEIAEDANEMNRTRHTVLAPAALLPYEMVELPEYEEPVDEKTEQEILIADITRAIVPVTTQGVLKIVPLGDVPVARTPAKWLDNEAADASV